MNLLGCAQGAWLSRRFVLRHFVVDSKRLVSIFD